MRFLLAALLSLWLSPARAAKVAPALGKIAPIQALPFGAVGAPGLLSPPAASASTVHQLKPVIQYLQQNVTPQETTPVQATAREAIVQALDNAEGKDRNKLSGALKSLRRDFLPEGARPKDSLAGLQGRLDKIFDGGASKGAVDLAAVDAEATPGFPKKSKTKGLKLLEKEKEKLRALQDMLYAQKKHSVLIVLQAMDTAGKDGVIKHVLTSLNPQGVQVTSFKKPTPEEAAHDFLWRIRQHTPAQGMIQVFNRSQYEDILVPSVYKLLPKDQIDARYDQINTFEKYLADNGVTIVKLYLHITKDEQKKRLEARLADPHKHWKFDPNDLETRKHWSKFMKVYGKILARTNTPQAPWHVIPANKKWYRNYLVARILRETLESLHLSYPPAPPGLDKYKVD